MSFFVIEVGEAHSVMEFRDTGKIYGPLPDEEAVKKVTNRFPPGSSFVKFPGELVVRPGPDQTLPGVVATGDDHPNLQFMG
jgi:hypothetical protein